MYTQQGHGQQAAYDGYSTGSFDHHGFAYDSYDQDPLFGSMPGSDAATDGGAWTSGTYDAYSGHVGTYDTGYTAGAHDSGTYATVGYDTGTYDTDAAWSNAGFPHTADVADGTGPGQADFGWDNGGQWDTSQWDASQWENGQWETGGQWDSQDANGTWNAYGYDQTAAAQGHDGAAAGTFEAHEAYESLDSYDPGATETYAALDEQLPYDEGAFAHAGAPDATAALPAFDTYDGFDSHATYDGYDEYDAYGADSPAHADDGLHAPGDAETDYGPDAPAGLGVPRIRQKQDLTVANLPGRRRSPRPRRSALLTVAVPSVAVMGVAAAAAASVTTAPQDDTTTQASADVPVKPANKKLDTQLAGLSADADDFADRASRTQERLDLQARQEAERKRKAKEAARKEALRPKFALPVKEHGLSATYGQAGLNWMSVHTGIDFPVSEGTPVMAATDGTVTTKYDVSFGNMAVVTAPDGTETWYCHLSSTKIRAGQVKAGDTIGYSGTSGNSTGPHLHFEVHPGGGEAIDPLPWLRGKGLEPN
ncbi:hypothetical protein AN219_36510 [Streptomyces nanshensis]|nr:hypothetical protein AN219_36510 [Streptomyces nanshensis]